MRRKQRTAVDRYPELNCEKKKLIIDQKVEGGKAGGSEERAPGKVHRVHVQKGKEIRGPSTSPPVSFLPTWAWGVLSHSSNELSQKERKKVAFPHPPARMLSSGFFLSFFLSFFRSLFLSLFLPLSPPTLSLSLSLRLRACVFSYGHLSVRLHVPPMCVCVCAGFHSRSCSACWDLEVEEAMGRNRALHCVCFFLCNALSKFLFQVDFWRKFRGTSGVENGNVLSFIE